MNVLNVDLDEFERQPSYVMQRDCSVQNEDASRTIFRTAVPEMYRVVEKVYGTGFGQLPCKHTIWLYRRQPFINETSYGPLLPWSVRTYTNGGIRSIENYLLRDADGVLFNHGVTTTTSHVFVDYERLKEDLVPCMQYRWDQFMHIFSGQRVLCDFEGRPAKATYCAHSHNVIHLSYYKFNVNRGTSGLHDPADGVAAVQQFDEHGNILGWVWCAYGAVYQRGESGPEPRIDLIGQRPASWEEAEAFAPGNHPPRPRLPRLAPVELISVMTIDVAAECCVCLGAETEDGDIVRMPCNHLGHRSCLVPWLDRQRTCPMCRVAFE